MARNWLTAFRPASFRGVPFFVENEASDGGRRVAVQHVAYGEAPVTEDFGRATDILPQRAYIASDVADVQALALRAACGVKGPGLLTLPMHLPTLAHCVRFAVSRDEGRAGYVAFDVEFIPSGPALGFPKQFTVNAAISGIRRFAAAI